VYANLNWWNNYLPGLDRFTKWVAQYNKTCDYKGVNLDIWQYSSKGKVDGIEGNVDMNECYRDFPKEIKDVVSKEDTYTLEQFIRDIQSVTGSEVDGIAGKETIGNTVTVSASENRKNPVVEFVQKRLATLGYTEVGEIDGIAGSLFDSAVKRFQEENGCVKDGEITAENKTWRKLLGME
jgi:GH25 family lysozyme M1 (1,4-beta-N-acetylmuramidase)